MPLLAFAAPLIAGLGGATAAATLGAAAIGAGATVYASSRASSAASRATQAQTTANNAAMAEQTREYDQTRADHMPWQQVGQAALGQIAQIHGINIPGVTPAGGSTDPYGGFTESPDYAYRRDQDLRAVTGNYAARGLSESSAIAPGLIRTAGQDASSEFGSWYSRLANLAGVGLNATDSVDAAGQAAANNRSNLLQANGEAQANGAATQGGIQAGLITGLGNTAAGLIQNWPGRQTVTAAPTPISYQPPTPIQAQVPVSAPGGLTTPGNLWGSAL